MAADVNTDATALSKGTGDQGANDDIENWSTFNFDWLFDPDRIDHLPIDEQLLRFSERDLAKVKAYKFAVKIWGAPMSRKRRIIAKPMYGDDSYKPNVLIEPFKITSDLNPPIKKVSGPSEEFLKEQAEKDRIAKYKQWFEDRKAFRHNLDNMGLTDEYLSRKGDLTDLERRVLRKLLLAKNKKPPPLSVKEPDPLNGLLSDELPIIHRPCPQAVRIIEKFLYEKQLRLIDLFQFSDRNKDWYVTRDEFREAITMAKIPISEVLLEDLILALDVNLENKLDYRELAMGMGLWKLEKRDTRKKDISSTSFSSSPSKYSQLSGFESPDIDRPIETTNKWSFRRDDTLTKDEFGNPDPNGTEAQKARIKSALSTASSAASSKYLTPPPPDLRSETRVAESDEAALDLRRRNQQTLTHVMGKSGPNGKQKSIKNREKVNHDLLMVVKTGDPAIDNHLLPSTLGGELGQKINHFRQQRYKEYIQICKLCEERHVPLTERLLKRVLLYPPDRPLRDIKKKVRAPGMPLFSQDFAAPRKKSAELPKSPSEEERMKRAATKVKVAKDGKVEVLVDSRRAYPKRSKVAPTGQKVMLSTGKAVIRPLVNCWLTFEEYEHLTRHLETRFVNVHGSSDPNVFWPGHLLDKMRLCMEPFEPLESSILLSTREEKPKTNSGYDNNLRTWPINDRGYVQYANIS